MQDLIIFSLILLAPCIPFVIAVAQIENRHKKNLTNNQ